MKEDSPGGACWLPSKSHGHERSVSRSRDPSQNSRGNSSLRTDLFAFVPAHQRDHRIGETNTDTHRKNYYDRRRDGESSRDRGHDTGKDRDRDSGRNRERFHLAGKTATLVEVVRDPTPERRSYSRERVDDYKRRPEDSHDKKGGKDSKEKRREC